MVSGALAVLTAIAFRNTTTGALLVLGPERLPQVMRDLGREYVLRYNRKYGRIGTLWAGRHRATR